MSFDRVCDKMALNVVTCDSRQPVSPKVFLRLGLVCDENSFRNSEGSSHFCVFVLVFFFKKKKKRESFFS